MMDYEGKLPPEIQDLGDGNYIVQGKMPDSDWEVAYAIALSNAGWQYEYLAGWWINGKMLQIDFRIFTTPKETFLFIDGAVWHSGDESQQDKVERLMLYAATKSFAYEPITVNNPDCNTYDACWNHVIRTFGRK